jgi:hypothetical protein
MRLHRWRFDRSAKAAVRPVERPGATVEKAYFFYEIYGINFPDI